MEEHFNLEVTLPILFRELALKQKMISSSPFVAHNVGGRNITLRYPPVESHRSEDLVLHGQPHKTLKCQRSWALPHSTCIRPFCSSIVETMINPSEDLVIHGQPHKTLKYQRSGHFHHTVLT